MSCANLQGRRPPGRGMRCRPNQPSCPEPRPQRAPSDARWRPHPDPLRKPDPDGRRFLGPPARGLRRDLHRGPGRRHPDRRPGRIFDPYFTTRREGQGLGLAITHSIIKRHQGFITVQSEPNRGTTFTIYLPASRQTPSLPDEDHACGRRRPGKGSSSWTTTNSCGTSQKRCLGHMGHEAVLARDGAEALEAYRQGLETGRLVDLVIMDLTVPGGMAGWSSSKTPADGPARQGPGVQRLFERPGTGPAVGIRVCRVVVKPFGIDDLAKALAKVFPGPENGG